MKLKRTGVVILIWVLGQTIVPPILAARQGKRPFTVADDVGYSHFSPEGYTGGDEGIKFSPNGDFCAVLSVRGRLDLDLAEESLRFYRAQDIKTFLDHPNESQSPSPVWVVVRSAKKEPIIDFRWLANSQGVAILEHAENGYSQKIVLADLRKKTIEVLVEEAGEWFDAFDISDREHYVYVAADEASRKKMEQEREAQRRAPMRIVTGGVGDLILPDNPVVMERRFKPQKYLRAAVGGAPFEVKYKGAPLSGSDFDRSALALSPDGQSLVTKLYANNIPKSWEQLYPPPYASAPYNSMHAGGSVMQYILIDLKTGSARALTDAPVGGEAGWPTNDSDISWSRDGQAILLSGTFIKSKDGAPSRPCVAVVDLASDTRTCVETLKARKGAGLGFEEGYHYVLHARFAGGDKDLVEVNVARDESFATIEYRRSPDGTWQVVDRWPYLHEVGRSGLDITIRQHWDQPPVLVASSNGTSRVIWDPNPQFNDIDLGRVKVYSWKDKDGKDWTGGLFMPAGYQAGRRYPLVIQAHGFSESLFLPSGSYPTAAAARELAAVGIAVLQIGGGPYCSAKGPDEASCEVAGFESGARQLAADGLVDLQKVGYIGFSRSCWFGMEMLTNGSFQLKAALLADGITVDYFLSVLMEQDFHDLIGAKPFGEGLQVWLKRSPGFHLDKVNSPLLIAAEKDGAISMWQPYSVLHSLHKPVEMTLMNTDEHVITNPVERMASQGLSVDWFRFWLQGHEDPDPAKAEQYKRWRGLRELQAENEKKARTWQDTVH